MNITFTSMNKRGQFYLIAAFVIIALILGLGTLYISSQSSGRQQHVYDLSSDLSYEGANVISSGIFNGLSSDQIKNNLNNLAANYSKIYPNTNVVALYSDGGQVYQATFVGCLTGTSSFDGTASESTCSQVMQELNNSDYNYTINPANSSIIVTINSTNYNFSITTGQNFYVIVSSGGSSSTANN